MRVVKAYDLKTFSKTISYMFFECEFFELKYWK